MNMFTISIKLGPTLLNPSQPKETRVLFISPVPYVDAICRQISFVNENHNVILTMFNDQTIRAVYMNGDRILSKPNLVESYPEALSDIDPDDQHIAERAWVCHGAFKN